MAELGCRTLSFFKNSSSGKLRGAELLQAISLPFRYVAKIGKFVEKIFVRLLSFTRELNRVTEISKETNLPIRFGNGEEKKKIEPRKPTFIKSYGVLRRGETCLKEGRSARGRMGYINFGKSGEKERSAFVSGKFCIVERSGKVGFQARLQSLA